MLGNFTWSNCITNAVDVLNATSITGLPRAIPARVGHQQ